MNIQKLRRLSYDEVAKCNKCGFCLPDCPVYLIEGKESSSPRGRNAITRAVIEGRLSWSGDIEKSIFSCLGCGACTEACFPKVATRKLVFRDRECLVGEGLYPKIAERIARFLEEKHNITDDENEERGEWQELVKDLPEGTFEKPHAEVIFLWVVWPPSSRWHKKSPSIWRASCKKQRLTSPFWGVKNGVAVFPSSVRVWATRSRIL